MPRHGGKRKNAGFRIKNFKKKKDLEKLGIRSFLFDNRFKLKLSNQCMGIMDTNMRKNLYKSIASITSSLSKSSNQNCKVTTHLVSIEAVCKHLSNHFLSHLKLLS